MKKMVCEICGSNDIEKKDGVYVCNSCGTRYSTEEAKKLLVEISGQVEISGSVKVDNSERLQNLYNNARRARDAINFEESAKYYDYILMEEPNSWEANFFSIYCKAFSCKIAEIGTYATLVANSFPGVLKLIKDSVPEKDWNSIVKEIATLLDALYRELIKGSYDFYYSYYDMVSIANDGFKCCDGVAACGDAIEAQFADKEVVQKNAIKLWNTCIFLCDGLIDLRPSKLDPYTLTASSRNSYRNVKTTYQDKINRLSDPEGYRRRAEEAKRQAEAAEKKRREEYEAAQPKTEEERLQRELESNHFILYLLGGLACAGYVVGMIVFWIIEFHEFPSFFMCLLLGVLGIIAWACLYASIDKWKEYKQTKSRLISILGTEKEKDPLHRRRCRNSSGLSAGQVAP